MNAQQKMNITVSGIVITADQDRVRKALGERLNAYQQNIVCTFAGPRRDRPSVTLRGVPETISAWLTGQVRDALVETGFIAPTFTSQSA